MTEVYTVNSTGQIIAFVVGLGMLVKVLWLLRHGKASDPDGLSYEISSLIPGIRSRSTRGSFPVKARDLDFYSSGYLWLKDGVIRVSQYVRSY